MEKKFEEKKTMLTCCEFYKLGIHATRFANDFFDWIFASFVVPIGCVFASKIAKNLELTSNVSIQMYSINYA